MPNRQTTVLHVDDDEALCRLVQETFNSVEGLDYVAAHSGDEAIEALASIDPPAIFLLDRSLPGTDLWELAGQLRSGEGFTASPLFVLSGSRDPEAIRSAYENDATAYLEKPNDADGFFELAEFLEAFAKLATFPSDVP